MKYKTNRKNIFFKMNYETLKYNVFIPQFLVVTLSFIFSVICSFIDEYQKNTNVDGFENPIVVFYIVNRYLYITFIIVSFVILGILANKEFSAEKKSRKYLNILAYSRNNIIKLHLFIMLFDLVYYIVLYIIFGLVLFILFKKSDIIYQFNLIMILSFIFIYSRAILNRKKI